MFSLFSGIFANPRAAFTGMLIGAALLFGAGVYFKIHSMQNTIDGLTEKNTILETNNSTLQKNIDIVNGNLSIVTRANKSNLETIADLQRERDLSQKQIDILSAKITTSKQERQKLDARLTLLLKDPKNNGTVAPALKDTIRNIQQMGKK